MKILKRKYLVGKIGELEIAGKKYTCIKHEKEPFGYGIKSLEEFKSLEEAENYILNNSKGFWEKYTIISVYYTDND